MHVICHLLLILILYCHCCYYHYSFFLCFSKDFLLVVFHLKSVSEPEGPFMPFQKMTLMNSGYSWPRQASVAALRRVGAPSRWAPRAPGVPALAVAVPAAVWSAASLVGVHRFSCSAAGGIFPDRGSIPCSPHWQADSSPLDPPEKFPVVAF